MNKIKFYKPNGKSIEVNDIGNAAEVMMKDGWTLDDPDAKKEPEPKKPAPKAVKVNK